MFIEVRDVGIFRGEGIDRCELVDLGVWDWF